jgi:lactaldehyde dehydrogenase/glycolaldehyde dehydrogenase
VKSNDSDCGLTASICTTNLHKAVRAVRDLKFGEIYVNRKNFEAMQGFHAHLRKSGTEAANGKHRLFEDTEMHTVYLNHG